MYEFLDRPVTGLDHGGRFLVWSMRSWVKAMGERQCPGTALGSASLLETTATCRPDSGRYTSTLLNPWMAPVCEMRRRPSAPLTLRPKPYRAPPCPAATVDSVI